ncbi:MAG TPA: CoA-binding protein [Abditibacteriaceae bacterium]
MISIAVIGASTNRRKFGNKCVRAYKERGDTVYPIHPVHEEVEGLKAYHSVLDVPGEIEVASFYVPSQVGIRVLEECAQKGIAKVLLNYGAESDEILQRAQQLGIETSVTCSIILAGRTPAEL